MYDSFYNILFRISKLRQRNGQSVVTLNVQRRSIVFPQNTFLNVHIDPTINTHSMSFYDAHMAFLIESHGSWFHKFILTAKTFFSPSVLFGLG